MRTRSRPTLCFLERGWVCVEAPASNGGVCACASAEADKLGPGIPVSSGRAPARFAGVGMLKLGQEDAANGVADVPKVEVTVKVPMDGFVGGSGPVGDVKINPPGCATIKRCTWGETGNREAVGGERNDEGEHALIPGRADVEEESIEVPAYVTDGCVSTAMGFADPGDNSDN